MAEARTDWKDIAQRAKGRLAAVYEENREQIRAATDTVEVWGAAGMIGWIHGRNGGIPKRLGIPLDLGLTGVAKLVAFMGWAGRYSQDIHSLGNGFGAYYFGSMGLEIGQRALKAAKKPDGTAEALGHPLSEAEAKDRNVDPRTSTIIAGEQSRRMGTGSPRAATSREQVVARRDWY